MLLSRVQVTSGRRSIQLALLGILAVVRISILGLPSFPVNTEDGVILPFELTTTPIFELVNQEVTIRFSPSANGLDAVEYLDANNMAREWQPLPNAPHSLGVVTDVTTAASRFYRVRSQAASPKSISLEHAPNQVFRGNWHLLSFRRYDGWTHWVQVRRRQGEGGTWEAIGAEPNKSGFEHFFDLADPEEIRVLATPPVRREDYEAVLVLGQSNALLRDDAAHPEKVTRVLMMTEGFGFRQPSRRNHRNDKMFTFSFPVAAAAELNAWASRPLLLVGAARGSTSIAEWMPGTNRFDMETPFGAANVRRTIAAPQGARAIWYYGHEGSMFRPARDTYIEDWSTLIHELRAENGPIPVIYAQVAKSYVESVHFALAAGAELQRQTETGEARGLERHHMVVTFDLPLADYVHLSPAGHELLGHRFALAMREHVYGHPVNGTGPRLSGVRSVDFSRQTIWLEFNRPINTATNGYDGQFQVFVVGEEMPLKDVSRGPDRTSVLLRLEHPPVGSVTVAYGQVLAATTNVFLTNVVRDMDGLPAPQFGPVLVTGP